VAWVDLLGFGTIATESRDGPIPPQDLAAAALGLFQGDPSPPVRDGEIAYLSPAAAGTLLLEAAREEVAP
jgi:hypothetical protein